jgi:hypothetical protein
MKIQNNRQCIIKHCRLFGLVCVLLYAACTTSSTSVAGGGTRGGNPVVSGKLLTTGNVPALATCVMLVPESFDPVRDAALPPSFIDTTDGRGEYRFANADTGMYDLEAVNILTRARALIYGVHLASDSVAVPADTVRVPGAITITLPDGLDSAAGGYFYVPGTTIAASLRPGVGFVKLDSVPAGTIPAINYAVRNNAVAPKAVRDSVTVTPGGATTVTNTAWKFLKKLYLNTTASGANVAGAVEKFPVLVRLNAANFDFSQAQKNGNDLRFTKSNGDALPFEIERWDSVRSLAEIWVTVDMVYGNDSTHFMTMYWGMQPASPASNGATVFDTANGYVGVWHLGPNLPDATINGDSGIDRSTADAVGIIGSCRHFDPALPSSIAIPNNARFGLTTSITLSAWIFVDTLIYGWEAILAKGDNTYRLHCMGDVAVFSATTDSINQTGIIDNDVYGTTRIDDHKWHLVCGVFDGNEIRIYTDGALEGSQPLTSSLHSNDSSVVIGTNNGYAKRDFAGSIDEVRIMHASMSADWVKLCYMNQKPDGRFVAFK